MFMCRFIMLLLAASVVNTVLGSPTSGAAVSIVDSCNLFTPGYWEFVCDDNLGNGYTGSFSDSGAEAHFINTEECSADKPCIVWAFNSAGDDIVNPAKNHPQAFRSTLPKGCNANLMVASIGTLGAKLELSPTDIWGGLASIPQAQTCQDMANKDWSSESGGDTGGISAIEIRTINPSPRIDIEGLLGTTWQSCSLTTAFNGPINWCVFKPK